MILRTGVFCVVLGFSAVLAGRPSVAAAEPIAAQEAAKSDPAKDAAAKDGKDAQKYPDLVEAEAAFRKGDLDAVVKALRQAVKKNPELPPPYSILAFLHLQNGQGPAARAALQKAVDETPEDPEAYIQSAEMDVQGNASIEASMLFEKALALLKQSKIDAKRLASLKSRALSGLAGLAESQQDWAKAEARLTELLAEQPKNTAALQQFGRTLFRQKKIEEARAKFQAAAESNSEALNAELLLAQLYHQVKDETGAGKWVLEAIQKHPRDLKTRLFAADWSFAIGKLDQAEKQADAALKLDPESFQASMIRGVVALAKKDYAAAEVAFRKADAKSPDAPLVSCRLALALAGQDDGEKKKLALERIQATARLHGDQPEVVAVLGWVQYRNGLLDEAEMSIHRVLTGGGRPSPDWIYFAARILADRGRKDDARTLINSPLMQTTAPFVMRADADALRELLK